jgi:hypothetical protein
MADLHLVPRLRMSGFVPPLPVYTFIKLTGRILPSLYIGQPCVLKWCWFLWRAAGIGGTLREPFTNPQRLKYKPVRSGNTDFD